MSSISKFIFMFSAAVLALGLSGLNQTISAQTAFELPDDCDLLAAHPADPQRYSDGLDDEDIIPILAITACDAAIKKSNSKARHQFQMGRAILAAGKRDEALQWFLRAAQSGSVISLIYLGDAEQFGWVAQPNAQKAFQFYQSAKDKGLEFAQTAIEQVSFEAEAFANGNALKLLITNDQATLRRESGFAQARAYYYSFAMEMTQICGRLLEPSAIEPMYKSRFPANWDPALEDRDQSIGAQDFIATYDAEAFAERHGCEGVVTKTVMRSLSTFFRNSAG